MRIADLEGGGQIAVLEYLHRTDEADARVLLQRWSDPDDPDLQLRELREATFALKDECAATVPFWMGIDLDKKHVLRTEDGQLKLIDLLGVTGDPMIELIESDFRGACCFGLR